MTLRRSDNFAKVIDNVIDEQIFTEYQLDILFESHENDYYEKDGIEYYRIYIDEIKDERYDYIYKYDQQKIIPKDKAIYGYSSEPATEEQLERIFEFKWSQVREQRNSLLNESDRESMIYLPDFWALQSEEYKNTWLNYRQELRDITTTTTNPFEIDWPTKPIVT